MFTFQLSLLASMCATPLPLESTGPAERGFSLKARVVESLAGGPLVIELTLINSGTEPITIASFGIPLEQQRRIGVVAPNTWKSRPAALNGRLGTIGAHEMKPGDQLSELIYVHHRYDEVPAGKAILQCQWRIFGALDLERLEMPHLASPAVEFHLEIPAATPERVAAIHKRISASLERKDLTYNDEMSLVNEIVWTKHDALLPAAFQLLSERGVTRSWSELRPFLYEWSRKSDDVHRQLIDYLCLQGAGIDSRFFDYWRKHKIALPEQDVRRLLEAKNPWMRAYTYLTFPKSCPQGTRALLLKESDEIRKYIERTEAAGKTAAETAP
jgi:hypothetical protein